jgi:serine/threonine-protein kinase
MPLAAGSRLGPYEIVAPIGAGGMGEVYKARDTRLDRTVAVKVLKDEFSGRFEREARAIAALNHPNICQLYDVGPSYLVMEFIEGETVAAQLKTRPLKLAEALRITHEAGEGLKAAHEKGIVHRDVKSANVMVTPSGQVKLMDFGLASARAEPRITQSGMAVGTPSYMAPEQARGEAVDHRADVWALGVVLYEMATGQVPFAGSSDAAIVHSILHVEPEPVTALRTGVPIELDRIVGKALEKDPNSRYQHVEDLGVDVRALARRLSGATPAASGGKRGSWRWTGVAAAIAMATLGLWLYAIPRAEPAKAIHASLLAPAGDVWSLPPISGLALARDGETLAYSAQRGGQSHLFLRKLDGREPMLLTKTEGGTQPFFSPDQEWIGFTAESKLKKISLRDGRVVTLADAPAMRGGVWTEDDWIYFTPSSEFGTALWRIPAKGGKPEAVTKPVFARDEAGHRWPYVIPGSKSLLFTIWSAVGSPNARVAALDVKTGEYNEVVRGAAVGQYTGNGYLVYARGEELEAAPFDIKSLKVTGPGRTITGAVAEDSGSGHVPVAAGGDRVIYRSGPLWEQHLVLKDSHGRVESDMRMESFVYNLFISLHGSLAAISRRENQNFDVWFWDFGQRTFSRFTSDLSSEVLPLFSLDGKSIVFSSNREGPLNLYQTPIGQPEKAERLAPSANNQTATSWTPAGDSLVYDEFDPANGYDIWMLDLARGRKAIPLVKTPFSESQGRISPDGKWLAYASTETGSSEIYVLPFPDPDRRCGSRRRAACCPVGLPRGSLTYVRPAA